MRDTWRFAPALYSIDGEGVFHLSEGQLPRQSLANEFFNPLPPSLQNSTAMEPEACSSRVQQATVFVATCRMPSFQMYDQLRHGVGTLELFEATFPDREAAARAPLLILDTSHRAIDSQKLRALPPSRLRAGLVLAGLAMGFNRSELAERAVASWPAHRGA